MSGASFILRNGSGSPEVVTPEASALLQVKKTGAAAAAATNGQADVLLTRTAGSFGVAALGILATDFSTDVEDGLAVYQQSGGKVYFDVGYGTTGGYGAELALDPVNGRVIVASATFYEEAVISTGDPKTDFALELISQVTRTDKAAADQLYAGLRSTTNYGLGGAAVIGTAHAITADTVITGSGSADSEMAAIESTLRCDIGTGFTQTTGPVGRLWLADFHLQGPKAIQPDLLNGITVLTENFYNGSPADSPSAALWLVSQITGARGTTYPMDVGLGITGATGAAGATSAFTIGIKIGGVGSGWFESGTPKIGTGISIANCSGADILHAGFLEGVEMTAPSAPAANHGRLYYEDNGGGKTRLMVKFATGAAQQVAIEP